MLQGRTAIDTLSLVFGDASCALRLSAQEGAVSVAGSIAPPSPAAAPRSTQLRQLVYLRGHPVAAPQLVSLAARLQVSVMISQGS